MKSIRHDHVIWVFLAAVLILLLTKIQDADAWLHLSLGREIINLKGLPAADPFCYTAQGRPFLYTSWLFGTLIYSVYAAAGVYGVTVLKAVIVTAAFAVMYRISQSGGKNHLVPVLVLGLVFLASRVRLVERPDIIFMLCMSFTIFAISSFDSGNRKYLYFLPLVSVIWANSHSSVILMPIPFIAYSAGGVIQNWLQKRSLVVRPGPSVSQLRTVLLILVISIACTLINPNGIKQITYSYNVLTSDWYKLETIELLPPGPTEKYMLGAAIAAVLLSFLINLRMMNISRLLLVLPFFMLPFSAVRFIFAFAFVCGPAAAANISEFVNRRDKLRTLSESRYDTIASIALMLILSVIAGTKLTPLTRFYPDPGFGFDKSRQPSGAVEFMDRNNIKGRVFNSFRFGQYIIWTGFPERTVFVDGRGDIAPELLEKLSEYGDAGTMDRLYQEYKYEAVLLAYPHIEGGALRTETLSFNDPKWALVYWDDQAMLYLRREGPYREVVIRNAYEYSRPEDNFMNIKTHSGDQAYLAGLERELIRNTGETGSSLAWKDLGNLYNETGRYQEAVQAFEKIRETWVKNLDVHKYAGLGYAYGKLGSMDKALVYYKKASSVSDDAALEYKVGMIYVMSSDQKRAAEHFEVAIKRDPDFLAAYQMLMNIYQGAGDAGRAEKLRQAYESVRMKVEGKKHFIEGLRGYQASDAAKAAAEFNMSIELYSMDPAPYSMLGYLFIGSGDMDKAIEYQNKAISVDPSYPEAYCGLAIAMEKKGDLSAAKKYLKQCIDRKPSGALLRRARADLRRLEDR